MTGSLGALGPIAHWWERAVVYQIYVRSFVDANGDGIGDLEGVRTRLAYLADLGVDAIWLNPCYPSPQHDHGYDVSDYFAIEPDYGDLATFDELVAEADRLGIRVMMDIVPNHCSSEHAWFRGAVAAAPGSAERDRFFFRDGRGAHGALPPNNWTSYFGGPAWTRVTDGGRPGQWYLHMFAPEQPDWNWQNADVLDHFDRALRFWLDRGVAGFRVDAPVPVGKAPGLPDAPVVTAAEIADGAVENPHVMFRPEGHAVWRRWRSVLDDYTARGRDVVMIAETYAPKRPDLLAEYIDPRAFHQVFGFDLLLASWSAASMRRAIDDTSSALAVHRVLPTWTLNNHDNQRSATRYGRADAAADGSWQANRQVAHSRSTPVDHATGLRRARAATVLMLGLPGGAYLYQGEELGLPEVLDLPDVARQDPVFVRSKGEVVTRDGCRVPIPWTGDGATSFGFSATDGPAATWLPQPHGWGSHALDAQHGDPSSMHSLYRRALAARRALADRWGRAVTWLDAGTADLLALVCGDVVVVTNFGASPAVLPATLVAGRAVMLDSSADGDGNGAGDRGDRVTLAADATVWLA